jgi:hypothetical protein
MAGGKTIVVTAYGHSKIVDKISVSLFDRSTAGYETTDSKAEAYCNNINSFELRGEETWVFAQPVSENTRYALGAFLPLRFDILLKLNDKAVQKVLRQVDTKDIAKALTGEDKTVQEKIFNNMSKGAAQMLKDDMKCLGSMRQKDIIDAQEKILNIICQLEETGEIIILHSKGEMVE